MKNNGGGRLKFEMDEIGNACSLCRGSVGSGAGFRGCKSFGRGPLGFRRETIGEILV